MLYLCSENKGADQLRGYREADLRLCFRICKKPVFSRRGSFALLKLECMLLVLIKTHRQDDAVENPRFFLCKKVKLVDPEIFIKTPRSISRL